MKYTHFHSLLDPNKFMLAQSAKATEKPESHKFTFCGQIAKKINVNSSYQLNKDSCLLLYKK